MEKDSLFDSVTLAMFSASEFSLVNPNFWKLLCVELALYLGARGQKSQQSAACSKIWSVCVTFGTAMTQTQKRWHHAAGSHVERDLI